MFNFKIIIIIIIMILLFVIIIQKVNTMFLLVYIKSLELFFWSLFSLKNIKLVIKIFLVSIWSWFSKNDVIWSFFVKFLELDQNFFIKIGVVNKEDLFYWCNWHNPSVNFDKKISTNLTKITKLHQFFKKKVNFLKNNIKSKLNKTKRST